MGRIGYTIAMSAFTIRPAAEADLPALTALYNHYIEHTPITFDTEPWTLEARRHESSLALTLANFDEVAQRIVDSLGAESVEEVDMSLQDVVLGYLDDRRGERTSLLLQAQGVEAS